MTSHPNQLLKIEELVEVLKRKHFGKGLANIWSRLQSGIRLSKHGGATKEERCLDFQLVISHAFDNRRPWLGEKLERN